MLSADPRDFLATCVVIAVIASLLVWGITVLRRSPFTPSQSALYALNYLIVRILWRAKIRGRLRLPPNQGAVIVCNHRCPLDPSFITLTTFRVVHWMVAKEYCEIPGFRQLLSTCEVIPVRRGAVDMGAVRAAIRLVERGEVVGIFPEGRINTTSQLLLPGRSGAAMIAMKAKAPIVPCFIHGAPYDGTTLGCLVTPASVQLTIGDPIDVSEYLDADDQHGAQDALTRRLLAEIARLADRPDFEPKLAGRSASSSPK
jgi:1-acyl-sn-glycerol-3-phosphate acyltransferase